MDRVLDAIEANIRLRLLTIAAAVTVAAAGLVARARAIARRR